MLEPNSVTPPAPDLACRIGESVEYFELGEIIEEDLARSASEAEKHHAKSWGGTVSLWPAVESIFLRKCEKLYASQARPLSLLLHYGIGRQASFWPFLQPEIESRSPWIMDCLSNSPFTAMWLYDAHAGEILARFMEGAQFSRNSTSALKSAPRRTPDVR